MDPDFESHIDLVDTLAKYGPVTDKSKVFTTCPICQRQRVTTFRCVKRAVRAHGDCLCSQCRRKTMPLSESARSRWQDQEYRERQAAGCARHWADPKTKEAQSRRSRKMWLDPAYHALISSIMIERHRDESFSVRFKEAMNRLWSDDLFRKRISSRNTFALSKFMLARWRSGWGIDMRQKLASVENRERKRQNALLMWSNPRYKERQAAGFKQAMQILSQDPAYKKKLSDAGKLPWKNAEFRDRFAKMRSEFLSGARRSSLEQITGALLNSMNLRYLEQVAIGPYVFDFVLPDCGMVIEVQGEYWHAQPKATQTDASKFSYVDKARPDLKILYLHERDFLNPACVRQKLIQAMHGSHIGNSDFDDFDFAQVEIRDIGIDEARLFLSSFHYGQFGRAAKHVVGAILNNELIAVCKYSTPIRKEVATSMGFLFKQVLELDRVCIRPNRHKKNFASWFVSRCCKTVFEANPQIEALVSFADATHGHRGTMYISCGWQRVSTVAPDYFYVGQDGWMMHKKTLHGHASRMGMREREYAEKFGYIQVMGKEKTKFRLDRPGRLTVKNRQM